MVDRDKEGMAFLDAMLDAHKKEHPKKRMSPKPLKVKKTAADEDGDEGVEEAIPDVYEAPATRTTPTGLARRTRGRASQALIEERRKEVWRLRETGASVPAIAEELNTTVSIIQSDLQVLQQSFEDAIDNFNLNSFLGETLAVYRDLEIQARQEFEECDNGSRKRQALLKTIKEMREAQVKLLQDLGMVDRKGDNTRKIADVVNIQQIRAEWSEEARMDVIKMLLQPHLGELGEPVADPSFVIEGD